MSAVRNILITGVSSGIGLAIATDLLQKDQTVIGISRTQPDTLLSYPRYRHYRIDLSELDTLSTQLQHIRNAHPDIDAIICNAGYGQFGSLEEFSYSQMRQLLDVNFMSHAFLIRTFIAAMKKQQRGNIVFIGSEAALTGSRKGAMYCASKFALRGFAQAMRDECGKSGVHISMINPGMAETAFYSQLNFTHGEEPANFIDPADVANAVWLVLSTRHGTVFDEINLSPLKKVIRSKSGNESGSAPV